MALRMLWGASTWRGQALLLGLVGSAHALARSSFDWTFLYVTILFVLVPIVSLVVLLGVAGAVWSTTERPARLRTAALAILPVLLLFELAQGNLHIATLLMPRR
jgi:hypothetical protein